MKKMLQFNLTTQRLLLQEVTAADLNEINRIDSIPEVDEYNTLGIPENIEASRKIYQSAFDDVKNETRKVFCWKVVLKENPSVIGLAGLFNSADRFKIGEMYYKLDPAFWGMGYGIEVAETVLEFGFKQLKLHRMEAGVAVENARSVKLLEKLGMECEGRHKKILPIRGEWVDNYHYAMVDEVFFAKFVPGI